MEKAGLENMGTSYVWVARRNIINIVRGYLRVVLKRMWADILAIVHFGRATSYHIRDL